MTPGLPSRRPGSDPWSASDRPDEDPPDGLLSMDGIDRWVLSALPPQPDRVPYVRRQASAVLRLWHLDDLVWSVQMLLGELAGNAVRHARTLFTVSLTWDGRVLRGAVTDANPLPPEPRIDPPADEPGGRGLFLVAMIANGWGFEARYHGKTVWFELRPPPPSAAA